ncbi:MAG: hypothetical protein GY820_46185 [Gammaproteobacteria bacterium]|nr:hypothetical protein [Gammaproteobacteria bacterium]
MCQYEEEGSQEDGQKEGDGAVVHDPVAENSDKRDLLLKELEERSVRFLSSVRSLRSGGRLNEEGEGERDAEIEEAARHLRKAELSLARLRGVGMDLPSSGAKSATMIKQRDQDPIELNRRKKRGERRRADLAMAAAEYVDLLNEQLTCQSCYEQGAPQLPTIWKPHADDYDTEDEEQWRWIKCTRCPDGQNLFHTTCVDPSLYQINGECFICEYCIGHSVQSKDGSVSDNLQLCFHVSRSWISRHRELIGKTLFLTFRLMFFDLIQQRI